MFDSVSMFTKLFTPIEGGYIYYPSGKSGGKLVTEEEFQKLVANWEQIAGRRGIWKMAGVVVLVILAKELVTLAFDLPEWPGQIMFYGIPIAVSGRLLWASFAPRRLVKERYAVTPPRTSSQIRRLTHDMMSWPLIAFAAILSGAIFAGSFSVSERTPASWAWLVGSGFMLVAYIRIGVQKFMDWRR